MVRKAIPLIGYCEKLAFIVAFRYKLRFLLKLGNITSSLEAEFFA